MYTQSWSEGDDGGAEALGAECDDGDLHTVGDTCSSSGVCQPGAACYDSLADDGSAWTDVLVEMGCDAPSDLRAAKAARSSHDQGARAPLPPVLLACGLRS